MNVFLVPAAAVNVTADCNGTSLLLSWQQPEGDLDALVVTLSTNGTTCWEATLPPNTTEVVVDQLTPSSAYQVVVTSRSGKLTNQSETTIRTGDVLFCFFLPFSFLVFSPSCLCPVSSAGASHPPLLVSLLLLPQWTPPVLDASCRPMGELHAAPVRRLPAVSPHRSGPRGS